MKYLDIDKWNRKEQYFFFREYDNPFFNICTDLDVYKLNKFVKAEKLSFFKASLYISIRAANGIPEFRYRIKGNNIIIHDVIHAGSTVLNDDETFSFCYFNYFASFTEFNLNAEKKLKENTKRIGGMEAHEDRDDLIHYSMIPWVSFTSFSHARKSIPEDSIPKIVFGKFYSKEGLNKMPVSVEVHHALMDGLHVGKYFDLFQQYLNCPEEILAK